jgi:hypothetical protein
MGFIMHDFFNSEILNTYIREFNLFLHLVFGSLAILTGFFNSIFRKNKNHKTIGKVYHWSVVSLLITSIIASLLFIKAPGYLIAFPAYYLSWFAKFGTEKTRNSFYTQKRYYY